MSITPHDLIAMAKAISANPGDEVHLRGAVSRAYYAAFHDCTAWHNALPSPGSAGTGTSSTGMHSTLIARLCQPTVTGQAAHSSRLRGYRLKAMKLVRVKADYKLSDVIDAHEAQQSIAGAQTILTI